MRIDSLLHVPVRISAGARLFALAGLMLAAAMPADLHAQEGAVAGRVVDEASGAPVASATVTLSPTGRSVVTNDQGHFRLADVPSGQYRLEIRHIRYGTDTVSIEVPLGRTLTRTFHLAPEAIEVEPLEVTVYHPALVGTGFYERMNDERGGYFITPEKLEQPRFEQKSVRQILRSSAQAQFRGVGSDGCVRYFLDGRPLDWYGLTPEELYSFRVAGIEVLGPGEAPLDFYRGDANPTKCSVVLVWREGSR